MSKSAAKILLVDDDDSLRRVLEFQLVEAGYEVDHRLADAKDEWLAAR
mgnify:CR=1 FL=1